MEVTWNIVLGLCAIGFVAFTFVIAFGAPYLPTLSPQVGKALDLIDLSEGQTLLELGCGDGRVMVAAAERGWNVIGYELNPILALICWVRTRKYGGRAHVVWGNFWHKKLVHADGIFVFLLQPYMAKLDKKIIQETSKPVKLVSFAFHIDQRRPEKERDGLYLYVYKPSSP